MSSRLLTLMRKRGGDADATAFLSVTGITDPTIKSSVNTLVSAWKAAGQWDRTVAIYPFVGGTADSHKYNLKDPRDLDAANRLSFSGTLTHDANGITPDGSTGIADTFIDFNLQIPQYSFSAGYYSRDNTAPGANDYLLWGQKNTWFDTYNVDRINVSFEQAVYSTGSSTSTTVTGVTNWTRLLGVSMNGPSSLIIYRDKTSLTADTTERLGYWKNSSPASGRTLRLFGTVGGPVWSGPTDRACAFFFVAWGMDAAAWSAISDAIAAFQSSLGRNV